jgi:hypothetical protein
VAIQILDSHQVRLEFAHEAKQIAMELEKALFQGRAVIRPEDTSVEENGFQDLISDTEQGISGYIQTWVYTQDSVELFFFWQASLARAER